MPALPDALVAALHDAAAAAPALPDNVIAHLRDSLATDDSKGTAAA